MTATNKCRMVVALSLLGCAPIATAQEPDSVRVVSRSADSTLALYFTRVPPPVHDTTVIHDTVTTVVHDTCVVTASQQTLRALAASHGREIGVAVRDSAFAKDLAYREILTREYNSIGTEDATDFINLQGAAGVYTFAKADTLQAFAARNGMAFHGHHLLWHRWIPAWVTNPALSRDSVMAIAKAHITTVLTHFKGKAASWDVVNEVLDNWSATPTYRTPNYWLSKIGPEYIDSAFIWARRADPSARLYWNEYYNEIPGKKADTTLAMVQRLRARGVPIDGVGFQMHVPLGHATYPGYATWAANPIGPGVYTTLKKFADAGFDLRITELDVDLADTASAGALQKQGQVYRDILDACLRLTRCKEITTWGFTDKYSWVSAGRPGYGRALPFDASYRAKPAYDSIRARLARP